MAITPREAYSNTVDPAGATSARFQTADISSGAEAIGRAAQGFGQDLQKVASNIHEIQVKDAEDIARDADNKAAAAVLDRQYGENGFFNKSGQDALVDQPVYTADVAKIRMDAAAALKNPIARHLFIEQQTKRSAIEMPKIYEHAAKQRTVFGKQTDETAISVATDAGIAGAGDPATTASSLKTIEEVAARSAGRDGIRDPLAVSVVQKTAVGKAVASMASAIETQSNAMDAIHFVSLHADRMHPEDTAKLMRTLSPAASKINAREAAPANIVYMDGTVGSGSEPATAPTGGSAPAITKTPIPGREALHAAQWQQESGGKHTNPDGSIVTSSAGAKGLTQVMDHTAKSPGYGVKPMQNNSREEYLRFGNDYSDALIKHYGSVVLGLTAYNWGPGNMEKYMKASGNDPRKGTVSEAAFINGIPVKEARQYAPKILARTGTHIADGGGDPAQQGAAAVRANQDATNINLEATISRIEGLNIPEVDKQGQIDWVKEHYSLGRQQKTANEERVTDAAWAAVNQFPPDQFTDYDKLPLSVRQQLEQNPQKAMQFKQMAQGNANRIQGQHDAEAKKRADAARDSALENFEELQLSAATPGAARDKFLSTDFRTQPGLDHGDRMRLMASQEQVRRQEAPKSTEPDRGALHANLMRFTGSPDDVINDKKSPQIAKAYDYIIRREQQWIDEHKKRPTEGEREGFVREALMPVNLTVKGRLWGSSNEAVPNFAVRDRRGALGSRYGGNTANARDVAKATLMQVNGGRIPSEAEIDNAIRIAHSK